MVIISIVTCQQGCQQGCALLIDVLLIATLIPDIVAGILFVSQLRTFNIAPVTGNCSLMDRTN